MFSENSDLLLGKHYSSILVGFYLQKLSSKTNLQAMKERAQDQPSSVLGEWQIYFAEVEGEEEDKDCQKAHFYGNWSNELKWKE